MFTGCLPCTLGTDMPRAWPLHPTRERMAGMKCGWRSDGIKADPRHMPHVVNDFKHYLWILKTVHAGSDMETMLVMAQKDLDDGLKGDLWQVVQNQSEWWVAGKAVECRQKLEPYWRKGYAHCRHAQPSNALPSFKLCGSTGNSSAKVFI